MNLTNMKIGESAVISSVDSTDEALSLELQELGFVPGSKVTFVSRGLFNSPLAFRVRGAVFALRREEASAILV